MSTARQHRPLAAAAVAVAALVLTACGGGSDTASDSASLPTGLQPQPLAEPANLTVTMGTASETLGAILLADKLGEFAKENITVNFVPMPSPEAIPALAQGKTDMSSSGIGAVFFNGVAGGADMKMVFPGATKNPNDGLYIPIDPATGEPKDVKKIATINGPSGMYAVPIARYLESIGKTINDVTLERIELAEMQSAMENGAVDAAWINAPVTTLLDATGDYKRVVGYDDGEYGVAYYLGPKLLEDRPEVGQAVVRALTRTVRDHLSGDYKTNDETVAALAEVLQTTPEAIRETPSMTFTAELPQDGIQTAQRLWLEIGDLLEFDTPLEPSAYVDTSFIERALADS